MLAQANIILQNLVSEAAPKENTSNENSSPQKMMETGVSAMLQTLSQSVKNVNLNSLVSLGKLALHLNTGHTNPSGILGSGPNSLSQNGKAGTNSQNLASLLDLDPKSFMGQKSGLGGKNSSADGILGAAPTNVAPYTGQNFLHNLHMFSKSKGQMSTSDGVPSFLEMVNTKSSNQTSLLGEPPPEVKKWAPGTFPESLLGELADKGKTGSTKRKLEESYGSPYDQVSVHVHCIGVFHSERSC